MCRAWKDLVDGHDGVAWQVASEDFSLTIQDEQADHHRHAPQGALAIQEALRYSSHLL